MTENPSQKLSIKQALAAASMAAMASVATGHAEAPHQQGLDTATPAEATVEASPSDTDIRLSNGAKLRLPGLLNTYISETEPKQPVEFHGEPRVQQVHEVTVDKAADIAKTLLEPPKTTVAVEPAVDNMPPPLSAPPRPPTPEVIAPTKTIEFKTDIPAEISALLQKETVYAEGIGCSGALIRDEKDEATGMLFAKHCLSGEIKVGSDGKSYIHYAKSPQAKTGDSIDALASVGEIESFVVPAQAGIDQDIAIASFKGQDLAQVIESYRAKALTPEEVNALQPGDSLFMSGWPQSQPENKDAMRRQEFAMTILGVGSTPGQDDGLNLLWAAVKPNKVGARCTPGASGSQASVERSTIQEDGSQAKTYKSVGTLARYVELDLTQPHGSNASFFRQAAMNQFGVEIPEDVTALCGFYFEVPPEDQQLQLTVVNQEEDIPGYDELYSPESQMKRGRQNFFDPAATKTFVDGYLLRGGGINEKGERWGHGVYRPYVFYDEATEKYIVGWHDPEAEGGLATELFDYPPDLYDLDETPGMDLLNLTGQLNNGQANFQDESGKTYGEQKSVQDPDLAVENLYQLYFDNGKIGIVAAEGGGKGGK